MAEPEPDPQVEDVRRFALGTYLPPIAAFMIVVAGLLFFWREAPPRDDARARDDLRAEGTTGTERSAGDKTPGGHNPDPVPSSPDQEVRYRGGGTAITELDEVFDNDSRGAIGRRVELHDIDVDRVESETLFWIRDGNARIAVSLPAGGTPPQAGSSVDVAGTVERAREGVRIRASRVEPSR